MVRTLCIPFLLLNAPCAPGQGTIALEGIADDTSIQVRGTIGGAPVHCFTATWRYTADGIVFDLVHTVEPDASLDLRLDRVVEAGLGAFLDAHVRFNKHGVVADDEPDRLLNLMNAMAWAAEDHFGASGVFPGFEAPTRDQLIRYCSIDWSRAEATAVGDAGDRYVAIHYFVSGQRRELERQLHADLLPLAAIEVMDPPGERLTAGKLERINSVCGTVYDAENYLCALDLTVSDSAGAATDAGLSDGAAALLRVDRSVPAPNAQHIRKRDRWLKAELDAINQRIDRMDQRQELWALRDRMEDLQGQIDDLRLSVEAMEQAATDEPNPIAALSTLTGSNVTIRFERYGTTIGPDFQHVLNEVFEQLARSPGDRVLITGYSDRSGDTAVNLDLSEARAKAVRDHLLERGIASDRLLLNYYGDRFSTGRDPSERRVEIEWLH